MNYPTRTKRNRSTQHILKFKIDQPRQKTANAWTMARYYSPEPGQDHYFQNKTYKADVCTNCGCWGDCSTTADGHVLTNQDIGKVVACPPEYPLGTQFNIEWRWWVTCRDRGGSIQWKILDIWMWYGISWLTTIETTSRPAGEITILSIK